MGGMIGKLARGAGIGMGQVGQMQLADQLEAQRQERLLMLKSQLDESNYPLEKARELDMYKAKKAIDLESDRSAIPIEAEKAGAVEEAKSQAGKAVTLTPEETSSLGFSEGVVVQRKPDNTLSVAFTPVKESEREKKIDELATRLGSRDKAADIVDGRTRIEIVPQTGSARLVNEVTNQVEEIPIGEGRSHEQPPLQGKSLWEQIDLSTGPVSAAAAGYAKTIGNIPGVPIPEETLQARTAFQTAMGDLRRGLSINPRFPVGEMKRIEEEVDIKPSIIDSPAALKSRMKQIDSSLRNRLAQYDADAKDTSLPQDTRSAQASNASAIRNLLNVMGVPQKGGDAPEGIDQNLWDYMTPEERKLWE